MKAIILANLPGEESGNALSDVLFGHVDASGRLPYTVGKSLEDYGPSAPILYYPNGIIPQANFDEGLYIDYRYFDKEGIEPRYPFGFGLSYTSFEYSSLTITALQPKSAHPAPRPLGLEPPSYETTIPDATSALFPEGFYKLEKYIYPYISSVKEVNPGKYPYPDGYSTPQPLSEAGGGQGGNPSLFETFARVSLSVTNSGSRAGKEVVQLYISFPDAVVEPSTGEIIDFPVKVLRNFEKVELQPGQEIVVELNLTRKDLSYWSVVQQNWVMPTEGKFKISVGRSSRNLPLEGTL